MHSSLSHAVTFVWPWLQGCNEYFRSDQERGRGGTLVES